jgi:hypothetical protein
MHELLVLAADVLDNGRMLSHNIIEWDRVHLEDIGQEAAAKLEEGAQQNSQIFEWRKQG